MCTGSMARYEAPKRKLQYHKNENFSIIIILNLCTSAFKAYCAIWVRRSNFRHQAFPRVSPGESTQRRKVELWPRNVRKFCLNSDSYVTFRDLLHRPKNPTASAGCKPANLGTKGQHATSRPLKSLGFRLKRYI